ncbi:MAG TPA: cellulose binding domain-containing protein [Polyangia bacterium]|nr:cellulose binding domain-containing protein [Polyangia bacterium]
MPSVPAPLRVALAVALLAIAVSTCRSPDAYYRHRGDAGADSPMGAAGFAAGGAGSGVAGTAGATGAAGAPCTSCQVKVEYTCRAMEDCPDAGADAGSEDAASKSGQASFVLDVTNEGATTFPLSALTLRYWYTLDRLTPQELDCDSAAIGCTNLVTSLSTPPPQFVEVMPPRAQANEYVEIAFTAGALALDPMLDTGPIQLRLHNKDFSPITQCDDYSYDCPMTGTTIDAQKITAYIDGILVWGTEPQ